MRRALVRLLDSPRTPLAAAGVSLVLGLVFVFVWAPHPWGWQGIDQYHEVAVAMARGEPFNTTDVPWGYAYVVAACYALFGPRPLVTVLLQVFANALVPIMLYRLIAPAAGRRTAAVASLLTGLFSFNTVYASTQSSDSLCTVLFLAAALAFVKGRATGRAGPFAVSGLLSGIVAQFRPNLLLLPLLVAGAYLLRLRGNLRRATLMMALFLAAAGLALAPWIIRNYRLTHTFLPTSTHGGVQLWYGSLQVGPYLESRAHNPRSVFEPATFDYTSLAGVPIIVSVIDRSCPGDRSDTRLVFWTDHDPREVVLQPAGTEGRASLYEIPSQPLGTTIYYGFQNAAGTVSQWGPPDPAANPWIYFVSNNHLSDLDSHGDLLDIFDVIRLARHLAWNEQLPYAEHLDLDGDGRIGASDLRAAIIRLVGRGLAADAIANEDLMTQTADAVSLRFADGSTLTIPRRFSGLVTDLDVQRGLASSLIPARRWLGSRPAHNPDEAPPCWLARDVRMNEVFYRREPHQARRYLALAFDNIGRDPLGFAAAAAYRFGRLFVVRGTPDQATAHQFANSGLVYAGAFALSAGYLTLFLAGVVIAWRRRSPLCAFLLPIVYVPVTICFVLTNMRYTVTVQPLMFGFMALALVAALGLDEPDRR